MTTPRSPHDPSPLPHSRGSVSHEHGEPVDSYRHEMPTLPRPDSLSPDPEARRSELTPPPEEVFESEPPPSRRRIWVGTGVAAIAAFAAGFAIQRRMPHPPDATPTVASQTVVSPEEAPSTTVPQPVVPPPAITASASALEIPTSAPSSSATEAVRPVPQHRKTPSERPPAEPKTYMPTEL